MQKNEYDSVFQIAEKPASLGIINKHLIVADQKLGQKLIIILEEFILSFTMQQPRLPLFQEIKK